MSFFIAFPYIFPQVWSSSWRALRRTNQPFSQSQNLEFGELKYIFGNYSTSMWVMGICVIIFCICANPPLVIAPMYPSGALCLWLLLWGWCTEVVVTPLQVLSTQVTLLTKGHYFCLLQETNIIFLCLCTFFQPSPRSAVTAIATVWVNQNTEFLENSLLWDFQPKLMSCGETQPLMYVQTASSSQPPWTQRTPNPQCLPCN